MRFSSCNIQVRGKAVNYVSVDVDIDVQQNILIFQDNRLLFDGTLVRLLSVSKDVARLLCVDKATRRAEDILLFS